MLSNINILHSLRSVCYYFSTGGEILPCFNFYIVTCSYSSRPFLCALEPHTQTPSRWTGYEAPGILEGYLEVCGQW